MRFYAVVNDIIGGWAVAIEDKPMSEMDSREGHKVICETITEKDAQLIARLLTYEGTYGWTWELANTKLPG